MTNIHVDVAAVKGIVKKLKRLHDGITRNIQKSNASVSGVFSARDWVGNSANEFNGLYSATSSTIIGIADELEEIADEIAEELQRWEDVASHLSS